MTSVQHAFLLAGARSTISSLDVVEDSRAREFMVALGEFWKRNPDATKAEALRQTQLAMIEKGWPPRDWAIWVLHGDPR